MRYEIKEFLPNIFGIVIKDSYDRAMLFCRCQEFYESPNKKFRGKKFSIWDYIEWYSREHNNAFTYAKDWGGFNIPFEIMQKCMIISKIETPYDRYMKLILAFIENMKNDGKSYVIGIDKVDSKTFTHELCHGLYYINDEYRQKADSITLSIDSKTYNEFKKKLIDIGYAEQVVNDEIQAYLMTGYNLLLNKNNEKICKELSNKYNSILGQYLNNNYANTLSNL